MAALQSTSMSIFCLFLLATATAYPHQPKDAALDNFLMTIINNFFHSLSTGIPILGLPPLDPLGVGNITIPTLTVIGGHVDASVAMVDISGLSYLTLTSLHADVANLNLNLRSVLPYLKISGMYSLNGVFGTIFPLYGDGAFYVETFDIIMLGGGNIDLTDAGYYQMTSLDMDANFTTIVVHFDNLLGGGDLGETINAIISSLGVSIFNEIKPIVIKALSEGIMKVVNDGFANQQPNVVPNMEDSFRFHFQQRA